MPNDNTARTVSPTSSVTAGKGPNARSIYLEQQSKELVFAVVGHVGSGTSNIAELMRATLQGQMGYDAKILKAKDEIVQWANSLGKEVPAPDSNSIEDAFVFQNLGNEMRSASPDFTNIARALVRRIRETRAEKQKSEISVGEPVIPDGSQRAYIIDAIRHPAEVNLLRQVYGPAFTLIGVVCEEDVRRERITKKFSDAGEKLANDFMERDSKQPEKNEQRVADAFFLADYFLDNTIDRLRDGRASKDWDMPDQLSRLAKIITHSEIVRPTVYETGMHAAYGAQARSACLSRQVGACLMDEHGRIVSTGTNEAPKAGGGVYGEGFEKDANDYRCAFDRDKDKRFCSNTHEQNEIIKDLLDRLKNIVNFDPEKAPKIEETFKKSRIGALLEFSRAVHAEMEALLAATRQGISTRGTRMFVTTYPCHYCARHLVAAGVDEVQYIEPYPKSKALALHGDAIASSWLGWNPPSGGGQWVLFRPFTGVAPRLYARAFIKDRELKNGKTGKLEIGSPEWGSAWNIGRISYVQLEAELSKWEEQGQ